jgi:hypothetical protein
VYGYKGGVILAIRSHLLDAVAEVRLRSHIELKHLDRLLAADA